MARMYSRRKGKSGSKKPIKKTQPSWLRYKPKEIELLVVKLSKEGKTPSQIGLHLRDTYGISNIKVITGKHISDILKEKKLLPNIPEDLFSLIRKLVMLKKHFEANKQDMVALRGIQITESKIKKLVKYYKKIKRVPVEWKYDESKISLFVE